MWANDCGVITRFAPSPTGWLHAGHAFAAWVAWRLASHGEMLLRQEDIDFSRVREEYYGAIEEDLRWLGLSWAEPVWRQSERGAAYAAALAKLREAGLVYPCFCTRREIAAEWARMGQAPQMGDEMEGVIYPGTCRDLCDSERNERLERGDAHAWRLNVGEAARRWGGLHFYDRRFGKIAVDGGRLGDVVVARKDIGAAYHLAVVVDDAAQGVTLVSRGEDLLGATHVHRILQKALDLPEPEYLHHPLVLDEEGKRLAKRHDALSLRSMRAMGQKPEQCWDAAEKWLRGFL
jgi:glutamyl-Q tRNA(Asp) synthetase